tara:strand:- start:534 stop:1418 length:885 start_codon:yes stop_codon:yes gene_type:complete
MINEYFENKVINKVQGISIISNNDRAVSNFGKQWKKYKYVQVDSYNNFNLSLNFLKKICHGNLELLKNKNVLEIGCGSGRFTEHISKYAKKCVSVDLSDAIFHNVSINNKNVILVKADFLKLISKKKFDVIFCRGVLQHTPNPLVSILKLHDFIDEKGIVIFDIYKKPKIGAFHPKYFFWRPLIKILFQYEYFEKILSKNIKWLLSIKRFIDKIFFNKRFFSDCMIPVWDYYNDFDLTKKQYEKLALLDTMDGLYAKYDKPYTNYEIIKLLNENKKIIIKNDKKNNFFISRNIF